MQPIELSTADVGDLAKLYARCSDYFILQDGEAPTLADAYELFTDVPPERDPHDQVVLGWKEADELYAVATLLPDYPRQHIWYLGFMIVDTARRNRGVGRSIYSAIERLVAARGARTIQLAVLEENDAGERFWRARGFEEVRRLGPDRFKMRSHRRIELIRHLTAAHLGEGQ